MPKSPYSEKPQRSFWRLAVADLGADSVHDIYRPKWRISRKDKIATAGSCFAQHIGSHLREHKFSVLDLESPPSLLPKYRRRAYGYGMYSARYGNIYTVRQLLQLLQEAAGQRSPAEIVWEKSGRYYDALRPAVEPSGLESPDEVILHRAHHLKMVNQVIEAANVFVFTLGLTEAWVHRDSGTVFPTAPGTVAGEYDVDRYAFKNFTFSEIYADFVHCKEIIHQIQGASRCRFLLTVSPVPLTATASAEHVRVATTYSKSVLRAVAGQLAHEMKDIDYFPSYEIVSNPWSECINFEPNLRSVTRSGVNKVMAAFLAAHGVIEEQNPVMPTRAMQYNSILSEEEKAQCEDELLDAFATKKT